MALNVQYPPSGPRHLSKNGWHQQKFTHSAFFENMERALLSSALEFDEDERPFSYADRLLCAEEAQADIEPGMVLQKKLSLSHHSIKSFQSCVILFAARCGRCFVVLTEEGVELMVPSQFDGFALGNHTLELTSGLLQEYCRRQLGDDFVHRVLSILASELSLPNDASPRTILDALMSHGVPVPPQRSRRSNANALSFVAGFVPLSPVIFSKFAERLSSDVCYDNLPLLTLKQYIVD